MQNSLAGTTIILTGSKMIHSVETLVRKNGGQLESFPLIKTAEIIESDDETKIKQVVHYDWLIFTSQNAVDCFLVKCKRHGIATTSLGVKIAAVGEKTAHMLKNNGFVVDFLPSVYSADIFVQEFQLKSNEQALFLRGSLAKSTITDGTHADEWTVYETVHAEENVAPLIECIKGSRCPIVIFASPSAVEAYEKLIAQTCPWDTIQCASIGHVTTTALAKYGVTPIVQPKIYTMQAVIEQLILEEKRK